MHSIRVKGLLKPTCGPCRPVQPAFVSKRSCKAHRKSSLRIATAEQDAYSSGSSAEHQSQSRSQPIYQLAVDGSSANTTLDAAKGNSPVSLTAAAALAGVALAALLIKKVFDTPSRTYKENVGQEYDSWTDDGVLEYYWGEHIHLGYYTGNANVFLPSLCSTSFTQPCSKEQQHWFSLDITNVSHAVLTLILCVYISRNRYCVACLCY